MPKVCIFCGRHGPFSREHVIPEWAARLLSVGRLSVEPRRMGVSMRPWATVGTFGHTVNSVCARCNNGWMAELEGLAKPVLARLIRPNGPVELSQDKQAFLTAWLWKLAIVHEHITSATYFNAAERRCLIRMDDPPTRGVHLWIGYYSGRNIAALRGGPSTFSAPDGRHVDAYLLSMNLRRFAAQLLCLRGLRGVLIRSQPQYNFANYERRIWPEPDQPVHWPPPANLTTTLFELWHQRWNAPVR